MFFVVSTVYVLHNEPHFICEAPDEESARKCIAWVDEMNKDLVANIVKYVPEARADIKVYVCKDIEFLKKEHPEFFNEATGYWNYTQGHMA